MMKHFLAGVAAASLVLPAMAQNYGDPTVQNANGNIMVKVANNAALKALTAGKYTTVFRAGYSAAGDGGAAVYNWSAAACSISGGDNGSQVAPSSGTGCWVADFSAAPPSYMVWDCTLSSPTSTQCTYALNYAAVSALASTVKLQGLSTTAIAADSTEVSASLNNSTITAPYLYSCIISASCSTTVIAGDAVRGVATQTAGSTAPFTVTGVAGYTLNNQPATSGKNVTVSLFGAGVCAVNASVCWGMDTLISDNLGLAVSSGTGKGLYNEADLNVTSPNTVGAGLRLGGTWLSQPAGINGFSVSTPWGSSGTGPSAPFAKWANAVIVESGAATVGLNIGAADYTPTASTGSMPVYLEYYDASSNPQNISLTATPNVLVLGGTEASSFQVLNGGIYLSTGNGIQVNDNVLLSADSGANAYLASASSFTNVNVGNGTATITHNGATVLKSFTVGSLPSCTSSLSNALVTVSDAASPTYNGALTGGGTAHVLALCNGTSWTSH